MAFLGTDYIVSSIIWLILIVAFVFTFRNHLKKLFYKKTTFDTFISKLKTYLEKTYPNTSFDFSIIDQSKKEQNPDTRKYLIVDNIIEQFIAKKLPPLNPKPISKDLQWSNYTFNCEPVRDKLPNDWMQRKNALLVRDNKSCQRCGKKLELDFCDIHLIKSVKEGGKYYFENLILVCKDCKKILLNDPKKLNFLEIKDDLYEIVKES